MCPKTEDALKHMINIGIHEHMSRQDVLDLAGAIRKVAENLPRAGKNYRV